MIVMQFGLHVCILQCRFFLWTIYITQYLQQNGGSRLSVSHGHTARDGFKLRNHSRSDIPVHLDLSKHTWSSHKAEG